MSVYPKLFPADEWTQESEDVPPGMQMFRYKNTELRIATIPGLIPGTGKVCGIYLLFRNKEDDMNMEVSVPCDVPMAKSIITGIASFSHGATITHAKFMNNLWLWMSTKAIRKIE